MKSLIVLLLCSMCLPAFAQGKEEFVVVLSSQLTLHKADSAALAIEKKEVLTRIVESTTPAGKRYRVVCGSYLTKALAESAKTRFTKLTGIADAWTTNVPKEPSISISEAYDQKNDLGGFATAYTAWIRDHSGDNIAEVRKQLHPKYGLFGLYQAGLAAEVSREAAADYLLGYEKKAEKLKEAIIGHWALYIRDELHYGPLNFYDCDDEKNLSRSTFGWMWLRKGQLSDALIRQKGLYADMMDAEQVKAIENNIRLAKEIEGRKIIVAYSKLMREFEALWFAKIDGKWYLILIDHSTPCGA